MESESSIEEVMLLQYGFEKPTPEMMATGAGGRRPPSHMPSTWAASATAAKSQEARREISARHNSITSFTIVDAANIDDAEKIAQGNPSFRAFGSTKRGRAVAQEALNLVGELVVLKVASVRK